MIRRAFLACCLVAFAGAAAVEYAKAHETARAIDFSDQERTLGTLLGSMRVYPE